MKRISIIFLICLLIPFCIFAYNDTNKTYKESIPFGDIKPRNLMYDAETTDRLVYDSEEEMEVFLNSEIESEHIIDLSTNKNQFYDIDSSFANFSTNVYILKLPPCSSSKAGKLNLYLHQSPVNGFQYDISDENISESSIPNNRRWMTDENDAIWKFTFESLPGTTEWILVRYLKHAIEPFERGYSVFYFDDGSIIITNIIDNIDTRYRFNQTLTNVILGNNINNISFGAFERCSNLKNVIIPNTVTNIGGLAFKNCTNLLEVIIPNSVENIGTSVFYGCHNMTNVYISTNTTVIPANMLTSCNSLMNVIIPESVVQIAGVSFSGCKSLTNIVVPNAVTNIGRMAFEVCTNLNSITIGYNVNTIGMNAFRECKDNLIFNYYRRDNETNEQAEMRLINLISRSGFDITNTTFNCLNPI